MKKKLSLFLLVCFLICAFPFAAVADNASVKGNGDVNLDNTIDFIDYAMLEQYLAGERELNDQQKANADVSGDGELTYLDYALIYGDYRGLYSVATGNIKESENTEACEVRIEATEDHNPIEYYTAGQKFEIKILVSDITTYTKYFLECILNYDAEELSFEGAYSDCGKEFFYTDMTDENGAPVGKVSLACNYQLSGHEYEISVYFRAKESSKGRSTFDLENAYLYTYTERYKMNSEPFTLSKNTFDVKISASTNELVNGETVEATVEICNITDENELTGVEFELHQYGARLEGLNLASLQLLSDVTSDECVVALPDGWDISISVAEGGNIVVRASASEGAKPLKSDGQFVLKFKYKVSSTACNHATLTIRDAIYGESNGSVVYGRGIECILVQYGLVYGIWPETPNWFYIYSNNGAPSDLVIPDKVTYGGKTLPVKEIQNAAFRGLELNSITIPASVKYIFDAAFADCTVKDIYCEFSSAPDGWSEEAFEMSGATIHWGDVDPNAFILGDVNEDGEIDQYDYILVKRHYFETRTLTDDEFTRADVNGDTKVDQFDYILIARHYFGTYVIK